jgi:hypothetical protein
MAGPPRVHAIIYSWPAVHRQAFEIAKQINRHVHRASVVACSDTPIQHDASLEVFMLDNSCYFGRQFEKTIEIFEGEVLLQIAADTTTEDWGAVARQCQTRFQSVPNLAIWSPDIDGTTWPNNQVTLYNTSDPNLIGIVQSDCIVWALSHTMVDFLRTLDFSKTPLGWGIDWAAIAHAYANGGRVMRDLSVKIHHTLGTGYNREEANRQKEIFLSTLSENDRIQVLMMSGVIDARRR